MYGAFELFFAQVVNFDFELYVLTVEDVLFLGEGEGDALAVQGHV
jgi:hypothetical protein